MIIFFAVKNNMQTYLIIILAIIVIIAVAYLTRDRFEISGNIVAGIAKIVPMKKESFKPTTTRVSCHGCLDG